jgi:hypothetical protein
MATVGLMPANAFADEPDDPPEIFEPGYRYDVSNTDSYECFVRGSDRLGRPIWVRIDCDQDDQENARANAGPDNLFVVLNSRIERFPRLNTKIKTAAAAYSSSYGNPFTMPAGYLASATVLYVFEPNPNPHWVALGNTGWSYNLWPDNRWVPTWDWGSRPRNKWYFVDGYVAQLTYGGWQGTNTTTPVMFHGCWFCLSAGPSGPPPPPPTEKELVRIPLPKKATPFGT